MKKILLFGLSPSTNFKKDMVQGTYFNPSLGLLALGTSMELNGYSPIVMDLCYSDLISDYDLMNIIESEDPFLIGITTYTVFMPRIIEYARAIKRMFPKKKIVLGGPHASMVPEETIRSKYVDFVIIKEGEATLLELAEAVSSNEELIRYEDIDGLVFKRDEQIIKNKLSHAITDLDIMPIVKRELAGIENYGTVINVSTSRGCPANCIYCSATAMSGASYRTREINNVFLELVLLKAVLKDKFSIVYILDDTFTVIPERIYKYIGLLKMYNFKISWRCESRVDAMTEKLINDMANAGCTSLQYGIESGNQQILDKINKGINLTSALKVIDDTHKAGILVCLYFMIGHYCDTKETMNDTVNLVIEMVEKYKADITLTYNTPYPGTRQYNRRDELGLRLTKNSYDEYLIYAPIVETDNFTLEDQIEAYSRATPYLSYHEFGTKVKGVGK